MHLKCF